MEMSIRRKISQEGDKKLQDGGAIFSGKDIIAEVVSEQNKEASLTENEEEAAFQVENSAKPPVKQVWGPSGQHDWNAVRRAEKKG